MEAAHYSDRRDAAAARRHADGYLPYAESPEAHPIEKRAIHTVNGCVAYAAEAYEEAVMHFERNLLEAMLAENDVDLEAAEANLADALLDVGRPEDALPHAVNAVRLCPVPGSHRRSLLSVLGRCQFQLGDTQAAQATEREIEAELAASGHSPDQARAELTQLRESMLA